jgi:hypothetical protein
VKIISYCRFYGLQFFRQQPLAAIACVATLILPLVFLLILLTKTAQLQDIEARLAGLPHAPRMPAPPAAASLDGPPAYLDEFDAADMVAKLHAATSDIGLPIDEVSYELGNAPTQPYLRYRVSLSAKTGYAEIRRFAAALLVDLPNISLDSIRCARDEIASRSLNCQLAFSAFYKRGPNG